ncbi:hypothetical protein ECDEC1A_4363 [Escherichia coli DEC1A]|nr:hypothetical protein ECDEC1C_4662 [Escherichia coli DEC1C]EHU04120.1 hypothetical protein ECDEC1A_4363 [Escherichia coli DEC1A]
MAIINTPQPVMGVSSVFTDKNTARFLHIWVEFQAAHQRSVNG